MTYPDLCDPIPGVEPEAFYAAADLVRSYCGWHIAPSHEETVTVDGSGTYLLFLPSLYVTAVEAITEDGTAVSPFTWSESGILERTTWWTRGRRLVTVTFTHGYDTCPPAVQTVVKNLARSGMTGSASSVRIGQVQVTSGEGALDDLAKAALARYRVI